MQPDVSVVIPTYNRRSMVQQAIESYFEGNDGTDVEVVVVDDSSTDGTRNDCARWTTSVCARSCRCAGGRKECATAGRKRSVDCNRKRTSCIYAHPAPLAHMNQCAL